MDPMKLNLWKVKQFIWFSSAIGVTKIQFLTDHFDYACFGPLIHWYTECLRRPRMISQVSNMRQVWSGGLKDMLGSGDDIRENIKIKSLCFSLNFLLNELYLRIQCITGGAFRRLPQLSSLALQQNDIAGSTNHPSRCETFSCVSSNPFCYVPSFRLKPFHMSPEVIFLLWLWPFHVFPQVWRERCSLAWPRSPLSSWRETPCTVTAGSNGSPSGSLPKYVYLVLPQFNYGWGVVVRKFLHHLRWKGT